MDIRKISLTALVPYCTTRRRGVEAGESLASMLREDPVLLNLDDADTLSLSFLDGLILRLIDRACLDRVTFSTKDSRTKAKLKRLAGTREANIRLINSDGAITVAKKTYFVAPKPKFSSSKPALISNELS